MDLAPTSARLPGASFAILLLAALLGASAPAPALAQASQATPSQATPSQAPAGQAPKGAAPTPAPEGAGPGARDGQVFQDWTLHCEVFGKGKPEMCEMRQRIVDQKGNRVMLAVVGRVPTLDSPGMLVLLPLGIALPPGASLKIDDSEPQKVDIARCEKEGCRVEVLLKPDLLARLKAGTKAIVGFHVFDQHGKQPQVGVPISLLGFSAALAEVMK